MTEDHEDQIQDRFDGGEQLATLRQTRKWAILTVVAFLITAATSVGVVGYAWYANERRLCDAETSRADGRESVREGFRVAFNGLRDLQETDEQRAVVESLRDAVIDEIELIEVDC